MEERALEKLKIAILIFVSTGLLGLVGQNFLWPGIVALQEHFALVESLPKLLHETKMHLSGPGHPAMIQHAAETEQKLDRIYRRQLSVRGSAFVLPNGDLRECQINLDSDAYYYRDLGYTHVEVRNMSHPDSPRVILAIDNTTFTSSTEGYLINLTRAAGRALRVGSADWIKVRLAPPPENHPLEGGP